MIRVLVLCEYPSLNGGEHSLLEAARAMPQDSVEWVWATPPAGPLVDRVREAQWEHAPLECTDAQGRRAPRSELRTCLAELIRRYDPCLVHANSISMARLAGPVVRDLHVASVGHLRDIVTLSAGSLRDLGEHRRLLAVSEATRDWYQAHGLARACMRVEYNGVDLVRFSPGAARGYLHRQLGIDPAVPLVGTIGQIGLRKGTDVFMAAAARVAASCDVHFLVVGRRYSQKPESCAFEASVRERAGRDVLRGRVHFLDIRSDIDGLLRELTVYVHAARQEPLGRVLLESAATGLPVVATDVGGTREIFGPPPSSAALLVPPDAVEPMGQAIGALLSDDALRSALGSAARQRAEAAFDVHAASLRLLAHYRAIAEPGRGRHAKS